MNKSRGDCVEELGYIRQAIIHQRCIGLLARSPALGDGRPVKYSICWALSKAHSILEKVTRAG